MILLRQVLSLRIIMLVSRLMMVLLMWICTLVILRRPVGRLRLRIRGLWVGRVRCPVVLRVIRLLWR